MTNREYFKHKKEAFYNKLDAWFTKHRNFVYLSCLVLDILLFITVWKIDSWFLVLFIPWSIFCFAFSWAMIELWLDKEHSVNSKISKGEINGD